MEALGALTIALMFVIGIVIGGYTVDVYEIVNEHNLREGKEVTVSNNDKYVCTPTDLTVRKLALEKELNGIK